jgi:Protein of unknown function (DUF4239)
MLAFVGLVLVGQLLVNRIVKKDILDEHRSSAEAMMGVVGTLFSVLIGFMVAGAMSRYQEAQTCAQLEASNVASLFRVARGLSDSDRPRIRQLCRNYVKEVVDQEWPMMERREKINHGWDAYQQLWESAVAIVPENDRQSNLQQAAITTMQAIGDQRRERIMLSQITLPAAQWWVLGFGAAITIAFTFVFTSQFPRFQGLLTTLVSTALALNIWLLAAYSSPFSGELKINPSMFLLLQESVLTVPDTPSRYLHDKAGSK